MKGLIILSRGRDVCDGKSQWVERTLEITIKEWKSLESDINNIIVVYYYYYFYKNL